MCGRFIQVSDPEKIKVMFSDLEISVEVKSTFHPRYNITPEQEILTVINTPVPELVYTKWGLIPFWAKDPSIGRKMINARSETIQEKNSFRVPFRKRRCIILTDGFYEWKTLGKSKTPFFVRMKDTAPFGLAGLWDRWTHPSTGDKITSCTIITTSANDTVSGIHDRMPAVLKKKDYRTWLAPEEVGENILMGCIMPYPPEEMEAYEVSRAVNNPSYDAMDCIMPA